MAYGYTYITGCLILAVLWLFIFLKRKNLRQEMLWASFLAIPFGFIDFFLVPRYWNPDSLFGLIKKYGFGIESFIFVFLMAGIASVVYEFLFKKKPVKFSRANRRHFWLILLVSFAFVIITIFFPSEAIYNLMIASAIGAIITAYLRQDLIIQMIASAFIFSLLYFGAFVLINLLFPGFVEHSYNLKNLWGIFIFDFPLEEIAAAFFVGAFWSTLYEYTKSYHQR